MSSITSEQRKRLLIAFPELGPSLAVDPEETLGAIFSKVKLLKGDKGDGGEKGETGDQGPQGEKGDKGEPGTDGKDGKNGKNGRDGNDGIDGKNGKDGTEIESTELAEKLNSLKGAIDATVIKGVATKSEVDAHGKKVLDGMALIDGRVKAIDMRWRGGGSSGLTSVSHDSTLTGNGTPGSPLSVVGGGGGVGAWSTPSTAPAEDGSVTVFDVTLQPTDVVADGVLYFPGRGYTYAAGFITFNIGGAGPTQYVRYR